MEFLKLSRVKLLNIVLLCLALNACSLLDPFIDRRREAGAKDEAHLVCRRFQARCPGNLL